MSKRFGRYILHEEIGRGGMGAVYKAVDTTLKQEVALKIVLQQQNMKRFLQECSVMSNLQHPNIVNFLGFGESPYPYFTMEYISGVSLADLIREEKLSSLQVIDILIPICEALNYMHRHGILHRDIKPSNIMIAKNGVAKLMDFGLAKTHNEESLSKTGDIIGTLSYMSPEQISGSATQQSDIYSIGATMYEALTSKKLFDGETHASILFQVWHDDPTLLRQIDKRISPYVEAVCLKCLEKNPQKRYQNFSQLITDLKNLKRNRPVSAKKYNSARHFFHVMARYKVLSTVVFVSFVLLSVLSGYLFYFLQQAHDANTKVQQEKRAIAFTLANVALREAEEARQSSRWNHAGSLAGTALQFVQNYHDDSATSIRRQAKQHIKQALFHNKLLWKYPGVYARNKRIKLLLYSQDDEYLYVVEKDAITLWDVASAKLKMKFSIDGEISDASRAGKNIVVVIRDHVQKGTYLFDTTTHQLRQILKSYPGRFIANHKSLVACYQDKLHVVDLATSHSHTIKIPGLMRSLCIDQSNSWMAGILKNTIYVWDVQKRKLLHQFHCGKLERHIGFVTNGNLIFIDNGKMSTFHVASKKINQFRYIGTTTSLTVSPTAKKFAFVNEEFLFVFEWKNMQLVLNKKIPTPNYSISLKCCFTNKEDVFTCAEYSVARYDLKSGKKLNDISDVNNSVGTISWSPDSQKILTLNYDRMLRIWNAQNGELLYEIDSSNAFYGKFLDEQNFVVYCMEYSGTTRKKNKYLLFYRLSSNTPLRKVNIGDAAVDVTSKYIARYSDNHITVSTLSGRFVREISFKHPLKYIRFHPFNDSLVLATEKSVYLWKKKLLFLFHTDQPIVNIDYDASGNYALLQEENNNTLHIVDLRTAQRVKRLASNFKEIRGALFTKDVKKILCLSHNESFVMHSANGGITNIEKKTTAIAMNPQKNFIAKGFTNGALSVEVNMLCTKPFTSKNISAKEHTSKLSVINTRFSRDGALTVTSYDDHRVIIHDTTSFKPVEIHFKEDQTSVDFNVDNTLLMSMGGSAFHTYNVTTKESAKLIADKPGFFIKAIFHPQKQQQVFSTSLSKNIYEIRLWDLQTKRYQIIGKHRKFIVDFVVSEDATKLFALELFGNITVWDISKRQRIAELSLINRNDNRQNFLFLKKNFLVAVGFKTVFLWNLSSLKTRRQWNIPYTKSACLSYDGQYLLTATKTNVQVRKVASGELYKEFPVVATCISSHEFQHKYLLGKANGDTVVLDLDVVPDDIHLSSYYKDLFFVEQDEMKKSAFDFRSDFPGIFIEKILDREPQKLTEVLFGVYVDDSLQSKEGRFERLWY
ncbi:WD40 repeat domain-containing serine/threonine protein kinase [Candidatus Uabimicrobium amorphum]|uniref:non-specific serine/threonine protein kinase n=1 Tax=Uabimicrobium amorphum TaxID=2596890 RepID=A0A5S9F791_UABAM|nr:WD40 repeat domain-containing serine/threonine protein kinase [Candidatus Uabimicrobium amorphum]BBM87933.1 serine/threonine protein kinase [Candidatus Uabimicrobium amorphum]